MRLRSKKSLFALILSLSTALSFTFLGCGDDEDDDGGGGSAGTAGAAGNAGTGGTGGSGGNGGTAGTAGTGGATDGGTLSQGQVVGVMLVANQGEILQAQAALAPPGVVTGAARDFAEEMITEHTANLTQLAEAAGLGDGGLGDAGLSDAGSDGGLAPQPSAITAQLLETTQTVVAQLNSDGGPVDAAYIASQIQAHSTVLQLIENVLLPSAAGNAALTSYLEATRTAVASHLAEARALAGDGGDAGDGG